MLQNAYLLAKIGADTAENEQHFAEICQTVAGLPQPAMDRDVVFIRNTTSEAAPVPPEFFFVNCPLSKEMLLSCMVFQQRFYILYEMSPTSFWISIFEYFEAILAQVLCCCGSARQLF